MDVQRFCFLLQSEELKCIAARGIRIISIHAWSQYDDLLTLQASDKRPNSKKVRQLGVFLSTASSYEGSTFLCGFHQQKTRRETQLSLRSLGYEFMTVKYDISIEDYVINDYPNPLSVSFNIFNEFPFHKKPGQSLAFPMKYLARP